METAEPYPTDGATITIFGLDDYGQFKTKKPRTLFKIYILADSQLFHCKSILEKPIKTCPSFLKQN